MGEEDAEEFFDAYMGDDRLFQSNNRSNQAIENTESSDPFGDFQDAAVIKQERGDSVDPFQHLMVQQVISKPSVINGMFESPAGFSDFVDASGEYRNSQIATGIDYTCWQGMSETLNTELTNQQYTTSILMGTGHFRTETSASVYDDPFESLSTALEPMQPTTNQLNNPGRCDSINFNSERLNGVPQTAYTEYLPNEHQMLQRDATSIRATKNEASYGRTLGTNYASSNIETNVAVGQGPSVNINAFDNFSTLDAKVVSMANVNPYNSTNNGSGQGFEVLDPYAQMQTGTIKTENFVNISQNMTSTFDSSTVSTGVKGVPDNTSMMEIQSVGVYGLSSTPSEVKNDPFDAFDSLSAVSPSRGTYIQVAEIKTDATSLSNGPSVMALATGNLQPALEAAGSAISPTNNVSYEVSNAFGGFQDVKHLEREGLRNDPFEHVRTQPLTMSSIVENPEASAEFGDFIDTSNLREPAKSLQTFESASYNIPHVVIGSLAVGFQNALLMEPEGSSNDPFEHLVAQPVSSNLPSMTENNESSADFGDFVHAADSGEPSQSLPTYKSAETNGPQVMFQDASTMKLEGLSHPLDHLGAHAAVENPDSSADFGDFVDTSASYEPKKSLQTSEFADYNGQQAGSSSWNQGFHDLSPVEREVPNNDPFEHLVTQPVSSNLPSMAENSESSADFGDFVHVSDLVGPSQSLPTYELADSISPQVMFPDATSTTLEGFSHDPLGNLVAQAVFENPDSSGDFGDFVDASTFNKPSKSLRTFESADSIDQQVVSNNWNVTLTEQKKSSNDPFEHLVSQPVSSSLPPMLGNDESSAEFGDFVRAADLRDPSPPLPTYESADSSAPQVIFQDATTTREVLNHESQEQPDSSIVMNLNSSADFGEFVATSNLGESLQPYESADSNGQQIVSGSWNQPYQDVTPIEPDGSNNDPFGHLVDQPVPSSLPSMDEKRESSVDFGEFVHVSELSEPSPSFQMYMSAESKGPHPVSGSLKEGSLFGGISDVPNIANEDPFENLPTPLELSNKMTLVQQSHSVFTPGKDSLTLDPFDQIQPSEDTASVFKTEVISKEASDFNANVSSIMNDPFDVFNSVAMTSDSQKFENSAIETDAVSLMSRIGIGSSIIVQDDDAPAVEPVIEASTPQVGPGRHTISEHEAAYELAPYSSVYDEFSSLGEDANGFKVRRSPPIVTNCSSAATEKRELEQPNTLNGDATNSNFHLTENNNEVENDDYGDFAGFEHTNAFSLDCGPNHQSVSPEISDTGIDMASFNRNVAQISIAFTTAAMENANDIKTGYDEWDKNQARPNSPSHALVEVGNSLIHGDQGTDDPQTTTVAESHFGYIGSTDPFENCSLRESNTEKQDLEFEFSKKSEATPTFKVNFINDHDFGNFVSSYVAINTLAHSQNISDAVDSESQNKDKLDGNAKTFVESSCLPNEDNIDDEDFGDFDEAPPVSYDSKARSPDVNTDVVPANNDAVDFFNSENTDNGGDDTKESRSYHNSISPNEGTGVFGEALAAGDSAVESRKLSDGVVMTNNDISALQAEDTIDVECNADESAELEETKAPDNFDVDFREFDQASEVMNDGLLQSQQEKSEDLDVKTENAGNLDIDARPSTALRKTDVVNDGSYDDDDFGDFDEAPQVSLSSAIQSQEVSSAANSSKNDVIDLTSDFNVQAAIETQKTLVPDDDNFDDNDFGDFDEAPQVTNSANTQQIPSTTNDDFDDDDFGDFDEAPQVTDTVFLTENASPMLNHIRSTFSKIFAEKYSRNPDDSDGEGVGQLKEVSTIEALLSSFETPVSTKTNSESYTEVVHWLQDSRSLRETSSYLIKHDCAEPPFAHLFYPVGGLKQLKYGSNILPKRSNRRPEYTLPDVLPIQLPAIVESQPSSA